MFGNGLRVERGSDRLPGPVVEDERPIRLTHAATATHGDRENGRHPVQIIGVLAHLHDLRQDRPLGPVDPENVGQLFQVDCSRFSDAEHGISQPCHAQAPELFVEELHAELRGEQGDVLDDGLTDTPLLVLGELHDGGQKRSRELLDANDCRVRAR